MEKHENSMPKARKEGLVITELSDEVLVYDLDRHLAHCLSKSAALVWRLSDGYRTVGEIASVAEESLGTPFNERLVWYTLGELQKYNLLQDKVELPSMLAGMPRREFLRKAGIAAAVGVPVVLSIAAPKAAQAVTCNPSGAPCTSPAQCCSGVCNGLPGPGTCA